MANYIIIGGDQKEYGPIPAEDIRLWIKEGRLNEHSLMKAESDAEFRTLEKFPEFADAFAPKPPESDTPPPLFGGSGTLADGDYELDIFGCVTKGWGLVKNNFGTLFVSFLVLALGGLAIFGILGVITSAIVPKQLMNMPAFKVVFNLFLSALSALFLGPLTGGLYLMILKLIRGLPAGVGDIFAGFQQSFLQLFLGYLTVVLATGLCMLPFNYLSSAKFAPLLEKMENATPETMQNLSPQLLSALLSSLPILLICMIPVTYLSVNWLFTQSLIIDQRVDFRTAMKTGWKRVHKHWWHVFGLVIITGLLNLAGIFLCCVGIFITVPVGLAALMFAYETIFSERPAA